MNDIELQREGWHRNAVSWGQFLLATLGVAGTLLAAIWVDRLALDRRMTILEERQAFMLVSQQKYDADQSVFRTDMARRLDGIQSQLVQISVDMARQQSRILRDDQLRNGQ